MRYHALITDYDGTLASAGRVAQPTLAALERLKRSGRRLVLVTGRDLEDLKLAFPELDRFDAVVAENGAVLYDPAAKETTLLTEQANADFVAELRKRGVDPLRVAGAIIATREPHETVILETIRDLGLELQVIFNKGAVMVLPTGITKASGVQVALDHLHLSKHSVVGIGDAENDHALLASCELGVAVANALPAVKERADFVTRSGFGEGVVELVDALLEDDLAVISRGLKRLEIIVGKSTAGEDIVIPPFGSSVLITGPSGGGKSSMAKVLVERLADLDYQFCIVDPEGDYEEFEEGVVLGDARRVPSIDEAADLLESPERNAVINLLGVPLDERPRYFQDLLAKLVEMRARFGRPHWIILDEAHHVLPASWQAAEGVPADFREVVFITIYPDQIAPAALAPVDTVMVIGGEAQRMLEAFTTAVGDEAPIVMQADIGRHEGILWKRGSGPAFLRFATGETRLSHKRHRRKYAEGDLGTESFYFRGPRQNLNLKAQNLIAFVQIADGVDDDTWQYHLSEGHITSWFQLAIKDVELAEEADAIRHRDDLDARESRRLIAEAVGSRYTLPADPEPGNNGEAA